MTEKAALFDITIPIYHRSKNLVRVLDSITSTSPWEKCFGVAVVTHEGDPCEPEVQAIVEGYPEWIIHWKSPSDCTTFAQKQNFAFARGYRPFVVCAADDVVFHKEWAKEALSTFLLTDAGVVGTNDLGNPNTRTGMFSTHPIVARWYAKEHPVEPGSPVFWNGYAHNCCDLELAARAKKLGRWAHNPKCIIEHFHHAWGKAEKDRTYDHGDASFSEDDKKWQARMRQFGWSLL